MRITLITDVPPVEEYTAGQVLRRVLHKLDVDEVEVLWINQSGLPSPVNMEAEFRLVQEYRFTLPDWLAGPLHRIVTALGPASAPARLIQVPIAAWQAGITALRIIVQLKRGRRSRTDYVWLALQGEKLVVVYTLIAWFESRRLLLQQWDPLSWWMGCRGHSPALIRLMTHLLSALERRVWLNLAPSEAWVNSLQRRGCRAHRIDNFFDNEWDTVPSILVRTRTEGKINAVFIGQMYANRELDECLRIIVRAAASLGRSLILHYFGYARMLERRDIPVVSHGFRSREDVIAMIAKWDFGILPYPMESKHADTARFSFPSKGRVYIAAGLPVLAYAPADSSVEEFFGTYYRTYYINASLEPDVAGFIRRCISDTVEDAQKRKKVAAKVVEEWFSERAELDGLRRILSQEFKCLQ